jgi:hypothetical protein
MGRTSTKNGKTSSPKNSMGISTNGKKKTRKGQECGGILSRKRPRGLDHENDDILFSLAEIRIAPGTIKICKNTGAGTRLLIFCTCPT